MIIVTGANGFIGSAFVGELNKNGVKDILCADPVSIESRPHLLAGKTYKAFLTEKELLAQLSNLNNVKAIFHIGACSSTTEKNWDYLYENNTLYSQKLFEYAAEKKIIFIYASSGAVYGDGQLGFDDQTDPKDFQPLNLYGKSKHLFDIWARQQTKTPANWFGFRYFNVYGPNEYHKGEMASVVFKAFQQIKDNGQLRLFRSHNVNYKDGEQLRDFVYVKDITRWMYEVYQQTASQNKIFKSGIYNLGSGTARTWLNLANAVFINLKQEQKIEWVDVPPSLRNQYQYFTLAKMDALFSQGLSSPYYDLESGVRDYIQNHLLKTNPYL